MTVGLKYTQTQRVVQYSIVVRTAAHEEQNPPVRVVHLHEPVPGRVHISREKMNKFLAYRNQKGH